MGRVRQTENGVSSWWRVSLFHSLASIPILFVVYPFVQAKSLESKTQNALKKQETLKDDNYHDLQKQHYRDEGSTKFVAGVPELVPDE